MNVEATLRNYDLHLFLFIFASVANVKRYDEVQSTCHLAPITKSLQVEVYSGLSPCNQVVYRKHIFVTSHKVSSRGHFLYLFSLVILQSHDCHPNPGPRTPKYPCQVCGKACRWSKTIKSVACNNCEQWYHKDCMQMNTATYEALEKTDMSWCCFKCGIPNFDTSLFEDFEATMDTSRNSGSTGNGSFNLSDIGHPKSASSPNPRKRQPVTKRCLKILNINFQSIRSKKEAFWSMLEYTEPDIILASETWLQPGITEREILPPDFRFVAGKDRLKDAHGGVAIIARSDMDGVEIDVQTSTEFVAASFPYNSLKKPLIVGSLY